MMIVVARDMELEMRSVIYGAAALLWGSIALVVSIFNLTPAFLFIAIGFLFAMRAVSAIRRADSLYARAAAAALAEGGDPIAMADAA